MQLPVSSPYEGIAEARCRIWELELSARWLLLCPAGCSCPVSGEDAAEIDILEGLMHQPTVANIDAA